MEIIADLSYPILPGMPTFPGDGEARLVRDREYERDGYRLTRLDLPAHAGTHIDLPSHLLAEGRTIIDFSPSCFIAPAVALDCRGKRTIELLPEYEKLINSGDAVIICTDFADLFGDPMRYYSDYPVLSPDFAEFLARRGVKILGLDTPSPDKEPYDLHKMLLAAGVFIAENLVGTSALLELAPRSYQFMALPLKLYAEASPVRAVAVR
ncbi:MAG TPA: cyclase family protein [Bacillota bacterium]|nr:cyclase family protein [Clostridiales bacterium]HPT85497.1 cyclase family protein [Bacillota bacterium]